jgi:hypothetical protein
LIGAVVGCEPPGKSPDGIGSERHPGHYDSAGPFSISVVVTRASQSMAEGPALTILKIADGRAMPTVARLRKMESIDCMCNIDC